MFFLELMDSSCTLRRSFGDFPSFSTYYFSSLGTKKLCSLSKQTLKQSHKRLIFLMECLKVLEVFSLKTMGFFTP